MLDLNRRSLLVGGGLSLIAAPAIVRAASLMPVRAYELPPHVYGVEIAGPLVLNHWAGLYHLERQWGEPDASLRRRVLAEIAREPEPRSIWTWGPPVQGLT
jgi:hypothetical protein